MLPTRRSVLTWGGGAALLVKLHAARADAYPDRPIRVYLPAAAGTGLDVDARAVMDTFAGRIGQPVVIINEPQAGGNVAMTEVARANADGYTLIAAGLGPVVANEYLYKQPGFGPQDFAPISLMEILPSVLVVHPSLGVNSVRDLIALAKSKPGEITYASQGIGTFVHLAVEQFMAVTEIKLTHVPYARQSPFNDLAGGHVNMMISGIAPVIGFIKSSLVKPLVVSAKQRVTILADVPTAEEAGIPQFQAYAWNGLLAPRGTPESALVKLNQTIAEAVATPAVVQRMERFGGYPAAGTPAEFVVFLATERAKWGRVIATAKLQID